MRSRVFSFLLSLSLIVCVGFGSSISAYAYSIPGSWFLPYSRVEIRTDYHSSVTPDSDEFLNLSLDAPLRMQNPAYSSNSGQTWIFMLPQYDLTKDTTFIFNCRSFSPTTESNFSFYPESVSLGFSDHSGNLSWFTPDDVHIFHRDIYSSDLFLGYTVIFTVPEGFDNYFSRISFSGSGSWPEMAVSLYAYYPDSGSESSAADLAAILAKLEDIEQSSDEIKGAIEDQYSGDPDQSFNVDDIVTQHNEKMGVLSFSSDVLMQVLGLLSPDQTLSSELVFPSMSLTVAGQRNKVQLWPEYRFDLNTLKEYWPDFIGIMQSLTTALVWIFVLRYCYRVFEKYFLAGGGS